MPSTLFRLGEIRTHYGFSNTISSVPDVPPELSSTQV